jgi:AcrR family transcriptional regulator
MLKARPRLDPDARREAILDVAQEVFLEEGFAAASMSTIAARLGGSKGTLYNYFRSKDELFKAYVERRCLWQQDTLFAVKSGETPEAALLRICRSFLAFILDDVTLRNFALIAAESERAPELGRIFYETGPKRGTERLAAFLAGLDAAGFLELDGDPTGAAQHQLGLLQSPLLKARLCNAVPPASADEIDAEARRGVRTFLRAFGRRA